MSSDYIKPAFIPVLLPLSSSSGGCTYTISTAWLSCTVSIPGYTDPLDGSSGKVFSADPCNIGPSDVGLCNTTGSHGMNVYSS